MTSAGTDGRPDGDEVNVEPSTSTFAGPAMTPPPVAIPQNTSVPTFEALPKDTAVGTEGVANSAPPGEPAAPGAASWAPPAYPAAVGETAGAGSWAPPADPTVAGGTAGGANWTPPADPTAVGVPAGVANWAPPGYPASVGATPDVLNWPPPAEPPRGGRPRRVLAVSAAVVLFLGLLGGAIVLGGTGGGGTLTAYPTPTPSPTPEPLSAPAYQALLTEIDGTMGAAMLAVATARDPAALTQAVASLRTAANTSHDKLTEATPPKAALAAHSALETAIDQWTSFVDEIVLEARGGQVCTGAGALPEITSSTVADMLRAAIGQLAAVDPASPYTMGAWLPAPVPAQNRQLGNGSFVKKGTRNGSNQLKIDSAGTTHDTVVTLVPAGSTSAAFSFYVRANQKYTATGIKSGTYDLFMRSGVDWDAAVGGFSRECSFFKFQTGLKFTASGGRYSLWTITMKPSGSAGDTAATLPVMPGEIPG